MHERTLLASVVLFKELYDSDKDIYDVIAEFIKAAMIFENKWAFNTTEATQLLSSGFGLSIPEAVIATTLRNRLLKRDQILSHENGFYSLTDERLKHSQSVIQEFDLLKKTQSAILDSLFAYVERREGPLSRENTNELSKCFCDYLFGNGSQAKYANYVSPFIIENQNKSDFTKSLNAVREGSVLYNGVRYTPDLNNLNSWKTQLVVFLDTEHLFNAVGYNGTLYGQLFKDLYDLANEVRLKGNRLITLRYFGECEKEIDNFFYVAELVVEGKASLDPSKTAMISIVNGCKSKSDVVAKKAHFYSRLQEMGITNGDPLLTGIKYRYNIESASLLSEIEDETKEKGWKFNEEKCINALRMFTKVNALRKGESAKPFEEIGYILVSGSSSTRYLAFHPSVKGGSHEIPFATDLDFITNRLWFRLKKGLAKQLSTPQSLNVLAKAQVVLSSQINSTIASKFDQIQADYTNGKISKSEAEYLSNELRTKTSVPEHLTPEEISPAMDFLSHEGYEHHLREKSTLLKKAREGENAKAELEAIKAEQRKNKERRIRRKSLIRASVMGVALVSIVFAAYYVVYLLILSYAAGQDSPLTIFGITMSFVLGTIPLIKIKYCFSWLKTQHEKYTEIEYKKIT